MTALKVSKTELRLKMKAALSALSHDDIATQTSMAVRNLKNMPEYQRARRISIFLSMPSGEISTSAIVRDALASGKEVFIPYTYKAITHHDGQPSSVMDMVKLWSMNDYDSLKPDRWGIPTPSPDSIPERRNSFDSKGITNHSIASRSSLDLIVMPGMGFDTELGRLGHGKGFYDYFLWRCSQQLGTADYTRMPFLGKLTLCTCV
ncbi:nagb/rpia/CoA transferase-like protein [Pseudovirgaria hyperparasitica]|uniref:5-formyltetrahydrofolate cyclo-ligase n=1 Tax=Pseudovirgaria hyperparasitica TaxID=470096 RepID=A0A6A6WLN2_9PEZI|nr:nagb/rpia/CoA transferase-like protein [Pseudovirgaria hyperparasitica]KAF2763130.1 nagb/rpia/CoA transferase-like protein [Pseudovirgaria hyperparasitica]